MSHDKDYVEYENGFLKRIRCMACGVSISEAEETPSKKYPGKTLITMRRFPNYRRKRVELSDGTYSELFMCSDCAKDSVGQNGTKIGNQISKGFRLQAKASGKTDDEVEALRIKYKDLRAI